MKTAGDQAAERAIEERLARGPSDVARTRRGAARGGAGGVSRRGGRAPRAAPSARQGGARRRGRAGGVGGRGVREARGGRGDVVPAARRAAASPPRPSRAPRCASPAGRATRRSAGASPPTCSRTWRRCRRPGARASSARRRRRTLVRRVDRGRTTICLPADGGERFQRFLHHEGPSLVATLVALALVWIFVAEPRRIPSNSMLPGLKPGDRVVVSKLGSSSAPPRWSVLVFRRPDDLVLIKRVVGLPGERVWIANGEVYADGATLVKPDVVRESLREPLLDERFERLVEGDVVDRRRPSARPLALPPRVLRAPPRVSGRTRVAGVAAAPEGAGARPLRGGGVRADARARRGGLDRVGGPRGKPATPSERAASGARAGTRPPCSRVPSSAPGAPSTRPRVSRPLSARGGARRLSISFVDGVLRASAGGAEAPSRGERARGPRAPPRRGRPPPPPRRPRHPLHEPAERRLRSRRGRGPPPSAPRNSSSSATTPPAAATAAITRSAPSTSRASSAAPSSASGPPSASAPSANRRSGSEAERRIAKGPGSPPLRLRPRTADASHGAVAC